MREREFQARLIKRLKTMFPGCVILKNDSAYLQGILDLSIFYQDRWAMLEVKATGDAPNQPNQEHYVELLNGMSFAAFIFPENEEEVIDALQQSFKPRRASRISKR